MPEVPSRVVERLKRSVTELPSGCWVSNYSAGSHGYSQIGWTENGKKYMALGHRVIWSFLNGEIPMGMTVDHTCKVRKCINPSHLRLLSNLDNARRNQGEDFPEGWICRRNHPPESLRPMKRGTKDGIIRESPTCFECAKIAKKAYADRVSKTKSDRLETS